MKLLTKVLPMLLLNTTLWVMLYYYIRSKSFSGFDAKQKKRLGVGLGIFITASAARILFQDEFIMYLGKSDQVEADMYQVYFQVYNLFFSLFTALGLFLFMSVGFSKKVEQSN